MNIQFPREYFESLLTGSYSKQVVREWRWGSVPRFCFCLGMKTSLRRKQFLCKCIPLKCSFLRKSNSLSSETFFPEDSFLNRGRRQLGNGGGTLLSGRETLNPEICSLYYPNFNGSLYLMSRNSSYHSFYLVF